MFLTSTTEGNCHPTVFSRSEANFEVGFGSNVRSMKRWPGEHSERRGSSRKGKQTAAVAAGWPPDVAKPGV